MPRTRSLAWSQLKIGVLAVIALVIAAVMIFTVGREGGFFWERYHLITRFADVEGLKEGAVVRVAGVEVGTVSEVRFAGAEVEVVMEIHESMRDKITNNSRAMIGSLSLLGEAVIDITASTEGRPLREGEFIPSARTPGQLADVAENASRGLVEATRLIHELRQGRGTIGRLFTDEALYREMQRLVNAAGDVATGLTRGEGTMGSLLKDPSAYRSLEASLRSLDEITQRINSGEGSLGRLMKEEAFAKSLTSATSRFDAVAGRLERGEGTAGKLVTDPQLYDRLNAMAAQLDQLTTQLNKGEGTAGRLLQDKQLYENMNGAASELRSLVGDIRKDPRKFLTVRVSIF